MITPSPEQEAIFAHIRQPGCGNLLISACAGGAKTTTLCLALEHIPRDTNKLIPPSVLFLAFNKAIADTLAKRVPTWVRTSTFHSLGLRALKTSFPRIKVDTEGRKKSALIYRLFDREDPDLPLALRAVGLLKSLWPTPQSGDVAQFLGDVHQLDFASPTACDKVFRVYEQTLQDTSMCDFDDMLAMPLVHGCEFPQQDWVLVDEAQDTNDVQLEILGKLQKQNVVCFKCGEKVNPFAQVCPYCNETDCITQSATRFLFVGDPHQAIYAFRGANADSMHKIAARFHTSSLPLSVSYRCPQLHVQEAQKYI